LYRRPLSAFDRSDFLPEQQPLMRLLFFRIGCAAATSGARRCPLPRFFR
jgi:hypothetical protein